MYITILFALLTLNGVFARSEISLSSARPAQLQESAAAGDGSAAAAIQLGDDPYGFLSTLRLCIPFLSILNGIVWAGVLARRFSAWIESLGVPNLLPEYL